MPAEVVSINKLEINVLNITSMKTKIVILSLLLTVICAASTESAKYIKTTGKKAEPSEARMSKGFGMDDKNQF